MTSCPSFFHHKLIEWIKTSIFLVRWTSLHLPFWMLWLIVLTLWFGMLLLSRFIFGWVLFRKVYSFKGWVLIHSCLPLNVWLGTVKTMRKFTIVACIHMPALFLYLKVLKNDKDLFLFISEGLHNSSIFVNLGYWLVHIQGLKFILLIYGFVFPLLSFILYFKNLKDTNSDRLFLPWLIVVSLWLLLV